MAHSCGPVFLAYFSEKSIDDGTLAGSIGPKNNYSHFSCHPMAAQLEGLFNSLPWLSAQMKPLCCASFQIGQRLIGTFIGHRFQRTCCID